MVMTPVAPGPTDVHARMATTRGEASDRPVVRCAGMKPLLRAATGCFSPGAAEWNRR